MLGGRLRLRQPRAAIASATTRCCWRRRPTRAPAEHVVDLGAGVGAAASRWRRASTATVTLVEIDPGLVALAAQMPTRNGSIRLPRRSRSM